MASTSRYSIRGLFIIVAGIAACFGILATPSAWWVFFLPVAVVCLLAVAVRQISTSPHTRPFWFTFVGSLIGYLAAFQFVEEYGGQHIWRSQIGMDLWSWFHPPLPVPGVGGAIPYDSWQLHGFYVSVHFFFVLGLSLVAAKVVQASCDKAKQS